MTNRDSVGRPDRPAHQLREFIATRWNRFSAAGPRAVFWTFLLVYLITWGGHYTSGDGQDKIAWAKALLFEGMNDIDPGDGVRYSKFGIGHTLVAVPAIAVSHLLHNWAGIRCEAALYTLIFVVNGALFLYLLAVYLWPFYAPRTVWATVAIIGLATTWWPYTKLDFSEPLVLTALFGSFLLMRSGFAGWSMIVMGFATTIRPDAVLLAPLVAWTGLKRDRSSPTVLKMLMGIAPGLVLNLAANKARYGALFASGYEGDISFDYPLLAGLNGILFSTGKSVILFSPPLLLGILGWRKFSVADRRTDGLFFLSVFVVQLVFYSKYAFWSGDDNWGVRFMIPGVVLMCIPLVESMTMRKLAVSIALAGFLVQLLAVLINGLEFVLVVRTQPMTHKPYATENEIQRVTIDDMCHKPRFSQLAGHWLILRAKAGFPPARKSPGDPQISGTPLHETLPAEIWSSVNWDFVWLKATHSARD